jgi:hypothetical protein
MNSDLELVNKEINQTLKNENNLQKEIQEKNIYELKNRRYTILRQLTDLKAERKRLNLNYYLIYKNIMYNIKFFRK